MRLGKSLVVTFHRTVRVPDGRQPANLPPSLGHVELYHVSDYDKRCPENWERDGYFMALHDTEAMWMSFSAGQFPVALLVGAGGVNALTGEKLGTTLAKDNYLVAPPQPWLDGWKNTDGTVYQFVATPYKKGKGISVAEQLIKEESKTGALGIALFTAKDPSKLKSKLAPKEGWSGGMLDDDFHWTKGAGSKSYVSASAGSTVMGMSVNKLADENVTRSRMPMPEMGLGKGGKIIQKIYADPHGLEVWNEKPEATMAFYLVNAEAFVEITGKTIAKPVTSETYGGPWFGMNDQDEADVSGSNKFVGLESATFPASALEEDDAEPAEQVK